MLWKFLHRDADLRLFKRRHNARLRINCRKIAISKNVGGVKHYLGTRQHSRRRAPFRSISWFALFQPGLAS